MKTKAPRWRYEANAIACPTTEIPSIHTVATAVFDHKRDALAWGNAQLAARALWAVRINRMHQVERFSTTWDLETVWEWDDSPCIEQR